MPVWNATRPLICANRAGFAENCAVRAKRRAVRRAASAGIFLAMVLGTRGAADVIYVKASAGGTNDGTSWNDAFAGRLGLQAALHAAQPGDEIWVAAGVYAPAATGGNRNDTFLVPDGVAVFGGFGGGEVTRAARNIEANVCALTGDLGQNGNSSFPQDNALHVVTLMDCSASTVIDGFTIRDGVADQSSTPISGVAGCVLVVGGTPTMRNCTIADGNAFRGGGIGIVGAAPLIEDCIFTGSVANFGANACQFDGSNALFRRCRFIGRSEISGGTFGVGIFSGAYLPNDNDDSVLTVEDCDFSIIERPFSCPAGTAIGVSGGMLIVRGTRFIDNKSCGDGAIHCDAPARIDRCVFIGNEGRFDGGAALYAARNADFLVTNSLFAGNDREGFSTIQINGGKITLANCTLAANGATNAQQVGGGRHSLLNLVAPGPHVLQNCIVWDNRASDGAANAVFRGNAAGVGLRFDRCLAQPGAGAWPGTGSFATSPDFVDALGADGVAGTTDDNLRLNASSPAVDRGDNGFVRGDAVRDLAGLSRIRESAQAPNLGAGFAPFVDLGCYEVGLVCETLAGDANCDCAVNFFDIDPFVLALTSPTTYSETFPACSAVHFDLTGDALVDNFDIDPFVSLLIGG